MTYKYTACIYDKMLDENNGNSGNSQYANTDQYLHEKKRVGEAVGVTL